MEVWICKKNFYCSPIDIYIPKDAIIYEYTNTEKIVIKELPNSSKNSVNEKGKSWEFNGLEKTTWFTQEIKDAFFTFEKDLVEKEEGGAQAGTTLYIVGMEGAPYKTIESAIDSALNDGVPNPLIHIRPGDYLIEDPILLFEPVSIKGSGPGTIIKPQKNVSEALIINGEDVSISDLVIDGNCSADVGVYYYGAKRSSVRNCDIRSTVGPCIIIDGNSKYCSVEQCTLRQFVGYAIKENTGDFNRISDNTIIRVT